MSSQEQDFLTFCTNTVRALIEAYIVDLLEQEAVSQAKIAVDMVVALPDNMFPEPVEPNMQAIDRVWKSLIWLFPQHVKDAWNQINAIRTKQDNGTPQLLPYSACEKIMQQQSFSAWLKKTVQNEVNYEIADRHQQGISAYRDFSREKIARHVFGLPKDKTVTERLAQMNTVIDTTLSLKQEMLESIRSSKREDWTLSAKKASKNWASLVIFRRVMLDCGIEGIQLSKSLLVIDQQTYNGMLAAYKAKTLEIRDDAQKTFDQEFLDLRALPILLPSQPQTLAKLPEKPPIKKPDSQNVSMSDFLMGLFPSWNKENKNNATPAPNRIQASPLNLGGDGIEMMEFSSGQTGPK